MGEGRDRRCVCRLICVMTGSGVHVQLIKWSPFRPIFIDYPRLPRRPRPNKWSPKRQRRDRYVQLLVSGGTAVLSLIFIFFSLLSGRDHLVCGG